MGSDNTATSCSSPVTKPPRLTESSVGDGEHPEGAGRSCTEVAAALEPRRLQRGSRPRARDGAVALGDGGLQEAAHHGVTCALRRSRERRKQHLCGGRSSPEIYKSEEGAAAPLTGRPAGAMPGLSSRWDGAGADSAAARARGGEGGLERRQRRGRGRDEMRTGGAAVGVGWVHGVGKSGESEAEQFGMWTIFLNRSRDMLEYEHIVVHHALHEVSFRWSTVSAYAIRQISSKEKELPLLS
ncbi:unnamed protein product [Miscanthus lutarioriparius]|uniref:Uncharacterized protein n=1 Tax=Miscanthus lutarioriparius TaxID=422564 RepID=A0A811RQU8_9POAL|nr:unnamed protein product [Miscanthus lutarioriparius]